MLASIRQRIERLFPRGIVDVVLQVALLQLAYMAYRLVRGWIDDPQGATIAFQNARDIIGIERSTGLFFEPHLQSALGGGTGVIADVSSWVYLNAQVTVTVGALMFLYLRHNDSFYFVRNMFMVAWAIALVGYVVFPTAPPRFFPEWGFVDSVSEYTGVDPKDAPVNALFTNRLFALHTVSLFLGYSALSVAFCAGVMYLLLFDEIAHKRVGRMFARLPSLDDLDRLGHRTVVLGFVLLTAGIAVGMVWSRREWGVAWVWESKTVWTLLSWTVYLGYLVTRRVYGWQGQRAAWLAALGFALSIITLLGSNALFASRRHWF